MNNPKAEALGKRRRLFYNKLTGAVIGIHSGGGALETLDGDDLIVATFNRLDAPVTIGCINEYWSPIGEWVPTSVHLGTIDGYATLSGRLSRARTAGIQLDIDSAFAALCDARDATVVFRAPVRNGS